MAVSVEISNGLRFPAGAERYVFSATTRYEVDPPILLSNGYSEGNRSS